MGAAPSRLTRLHGRVRHSQASEARWYVDDLPPQQRALPPGLRSPLTENSPKALRFTEATQVLGACGHSLPQRARLLPWRPSAAEVGGRWERKQAAHAPRVVCFRLQQPPTRAEHFTPAWADPVSALKNDLGKNRINGARRPKSHWDCVPRQILRRDGSRNEKGHRDYVIVATEMSAGVTGPA